MEAASEGDARSTASPFFPWTTSAGPTGLDARGLAADARRRAGPRWQAGLLLLDEPSLGLARMLRRRDFPHRPRAERARGRRRGWSSSRKTARIALGTGGSRVRARGRPSRGRGHEAGAPGEEVGPPKRPRVLMADFMQQVVAGLASGSIYAALVLSAARARPHRASWIDGNPPRRARWPVNPLDVHRRRDSITNHGWQKTGRRWCSPRGAIRRRREGLPDDHQAERQGPGSVVVIVTIGLLILINAV